MQTEGPCSDCAFRGCLIESTVLAKTCLLEYLGFTVHKMLAVHSRWTVATYHLHSIKKKLIFPFVSKSLCQFLMKFEVSNELPEL